MSSATKKRTTVAYEQDDAGIECSPSGCAEMCGSCLMFIMTLAAIASLGIIAGGSFWTAQSMYRVTSNANTVRVVLCMPTQTTSMGDGVVSVDTTSNMFNGLVGRCDTTAT